MEAFNLSRTLVGTRAAMKAFTTRILGCAIVELEKVRMNETKRVLKWLTDKSRLGGDASKAEAVYER